ncbi:unnamed protein product [Schistosoma rodhaini]|uniref:PAS domain-containing protein n=1 Tax=Schistosoma rodhaini TaxID=6188 RepID=A0AA85EMT4_9TREM|nr:unnamed protein product [Schistosoma rodhaini]
MCLPTTAPRSLPDCPTRNYNKSRKKNVSSHEKEKLKVDNQSYKPSLPSDYNPIISKNYDLQVKSENHSKGKQTYERREKSRIAARQRRHRENQALVELYLTLPIQQNLAVDVLKNKCHKVGQLGGDNHEQILDGLTESSSLLNTIGELDFAPTYRLATTIFRQHNLSTPVLEKAVIVRIASNSLCLYNWLYPSTESDSNTKPQNKLPLVGCHPTESDSSSSSITCMEMSDCYDNTTATTTSSSGTLGIQIPLASSTTPVFPKSVLSVHSKCLVAIIVDATHNIIIYAPPAYTELIGLSWVTTIGLKLNELVSRQVSIGVSSELRSHNCCHYLRNLQYGKYSSVENMITNSKQKSIQTELGDMEYVEYDPVAISNHTLKSAQIHQQFKQPLSCEMIWPSSYGITNRPLCLSSVLPKPISVSPSHIECSEHSNDETNLGSVQGFQDPSIANTSVSKHIAEQFVLCWNSSNVSIRNKFSKHEDFTSDISCSSLSPSSSSLSSSSPLPFSNNHINYKQTNNFSSNPNHNINNRTDIGYCNSTEILLHNHNDSYPSNKNNSGDSEADYPFKSNRANDINLQIYLLQPIHLPNINNNTHDYVNKENYESCFTDNNNIHNHSDRINNNIMNGNNISYNNHRNNTVQKNNTFVKFINNNNSCCTSLSNSCRTYHSTKNLQFIDIANDFLTQSGYTKVDLLNKCLFDLIHIDDLVHVSEAINIVNENQPVVTSFYRLRLKCEKYCWARMLIFYCKQSYYHLSNTSSISTNNRLNNYQYPINEISSYCMNFNEHYMIKNDKYFSSSESGNFDKLNSFDKCTSSELLVCCHQLSHFYYCNDLSESSVTFEKEISNQLNVVKQPQFELINCEHLHGYNDSTSDSSIYTSQLLTTTTPTSQQDLMTKSNNNSDINNNDNNKTKYKYETTDFVSDSYESQCFSVPASSYVQGYSIFPSDEPNQLDELISSSSPSSEKEISSGSSFNSSISLSPSQHFQSYVTTSPEKNIHITNDQEGFTLSTIGLKMKSDDHHLFNHSKHSVVANLTNTISDLTKKNITNLSCSTTKLCTHSSSSLQDVMYNKFGNSCSTTKTDSRMNPIVSCNVESQSTSQAFKQILPNKLFSFSKQCQNQRNPFNYNLRNNIKMPKFPNRGHYHPYTNCHSIRFNNSDSHRFLQKPHIESSNTSMNIFDYSPKGYKSTFLPQAHICPVFNDVVHKEPDDVYLVPPKKPRLYPPINNKDTNEFNLISNNINHSKESCNHMINELQFTNFINNRYFSTVNNNQHHLYKHVYDYTDNHIDNNNYDNEDYNFNNYSKNYIFQNSIRCQCCNNYELLNLYPQYYHQNSQYHLDYQQQQSQPLLHHHHQQSYTFDNFTNNSTLIY